MRNSRMLVGLTLAAAMAGCADAVAPHRGIQAHDGPLNGAQPHLSAPLVLNAFLSAVGDVNGGPAYAAVGRMQLTLGWKTSLDASLNLFPPGPCRNTTLLPAVQDGAALLGVCAYIDNPGGATLVGGGLTLVAQPGRMALAFGGLGTYPPGPCRSYLIRGTLLIDGDAALALSSHPGDFAALFEFQEVNETPQLFGAFGPSSGGPGDLGAIVGFQEVNENPPPPCVIDVSVATRS